ncbi:MAG: hypothetical protein WDO13_07700 [Verrucomicrobiota bacterium]
MAAEVKAREGLLKTLQTLGVQHDAWAQVLETLNEKIPDGVWITEVIPVSNPPGGDGRLRRARAATAGAPPRPPRPTATSTCCSSAVSITPTRRPR